MQIANVRLRLNKVGSDVPVLGCTPAEALLLHVLHQANNGGSTFGEEFEKISITGEAQTVIGQEPEKVIPAVEAVPAVPAQAAKPAVGVVGQPNYQPPVSAVAAVPGVPAQPEQVIPAKDITRARTNTEELRRLTGKYGSNVNKRGDRILKLIWPGLDATLPQNFSDLDWKNIQYDGTEVAALNYVTGTPAATK